jgi:hypothetical protein
MDNKCKIPVKNDKFLTGFFTEQIKINLFSSVQAGFIRVPLFH